MTDTTQIYTSLLILSLNDARPSLARSICRRRRRPAIRRRVPAGKDDSREIHQVIACKPLAFTRFSNFSDGPSGRFSPRSHLLTASLRTLRRSEDNNSEYKPLMRISYAVF